MVATIVLVGNRHEPIVALPKSRVILPVLMSGTNAVSDRSDDRQAEPSVSTQVGEFALDESDPAQVATVAHEDRLDLDYSRKSLISRDLRGIYLLLDHLSGRSDRHISTLQLDQPNEDYGKQPPDPNQPPFVRRNLIQSVCEIDWPPEGKKSRESAIAATTLFTARDILNDIAAPASDMTIAFTIMVTERCKTRRPLLAAWRWATARRQNGPAPDTAAIKGLYADIDRTRFARVAYPHLEEAANELSNLMVNRIALLFVSIFFTACLSWNVTSGKLIIERLNSLKLRAAAEAARIVSADEGRSQGVTASTGTSDDVPDAASTLDTVCVTRTGKAVVRAQAAGGVNPLIADALCESGFAIMAQRYATDAALASWLAGWARLPFLNLGTLTRTRSDGPLAAAEEANFNRVKVRDVAILEQEAGDLNSVLASYVLPMLYGLVGSTAAVIRSLNFKMRESTLAPRDISASRVQLVLGIIIGACIGLFVSPTGAPEAQLPNVTLAGNAVALSASALAFLAGFGVEAVFKWIETVITIAFAAGAASGGAPARRRDQASLPVPPG